MPGKNINKSPLSSSDPALVAAICFEILESGEKSCVSKWNLLTAIKAEILQTHLQKPQKRVCSKGKNPNVCVSEPLQPEVLRPIQNKTIKLYVHMLYSTILKHLI